MEVKLEYFNNHFIDFDLHTFNFLVGPNRKIKQQLLATINREKSGKSLSELEENYYSNDGINIFCDDKVINHRNINFKLITSLTELTNELTLNKNSLLMNYLKSLDDDFIIQKTITQLNDMVINLENIIQDKINNLDNKKHLIAELSLLSYENLIKNNLLLSFNESDDNDNIPVNMAQSQQIIHLFLNLLKVTLQITNHPYWLFLTNLKQIFASDEEINDFISQLREIAEDTDLLKVFIILDEIPEFNMTTEDIERTIYLGDFIEQLPAFWMLKRSLILHYPYEFNLSDQQLVKSFYRVINCVGNANNLYLNNEDMLLLKTLEEIL